ncbi:hypothetical protein Pla175_35020 [Pirellulimonas nuda]|uniref:Uncharacterized protein n=1 Tax=Pirellulimonas nuda TaxID=2528009 RepID=A0A518DF89_9BACT|nr:hypothetical protein [Pirellulimonas nuda]QDU90102.1 hypothetical protein Pla175_35020 [Pirellulimonas nuda]
MNRPTLAMLAAPCLAAMSLAAPAQAFWLDCFCDHVREGYCENSHWPSPYLCPDRKYAAAPFDIMVRNGWRQQNLMGAHHFHPETCELTDAGKIKIRWIMTQAPPEYRQVFVERSNEPEHTEQRIAKVQDFSTQVSTDGVPAMVTETHLVSQGRPATVVDSVNTRFQDNMKPPVLPASTAGSTGQ